MSNYPDNMDYSQVEGEAEIPDEVRISLDEITIGDDDHIITSMDLWVVIEPATETIVRFERDGDGDVIVADWFRAAIVAWLSTPDGQKHIQHSIDVALEDM